MYPFGTDSDPYDETLDDTLHYLRHKKRITPSQEKMLRHMFEQQKQGMKWFSWADFITLNLSHGTIRNNLMRLKNMELIELTHKSNEAYYHLVQESVKRVMTLDHLRVNSDDTLVTLENSYELTSFLRRLTYDTPAVHNIWLSFHSPHIYETLKPLATGTKTTNNQIITIVPRSNELVLPDEKLENNTIKARITITTHDTVTISLACSDYPIHTDPEGLAILTSCLSRLEDRLHSTVSVATAPFPPNAIIIPAYRNWLVTMWHLNLDSKQRYAGPAFEQTWEQITGVIYRLYTHLLKREKQHVLRFERQEHPDKPIMDAFEQIIKMTGK